MKTTHAKKLLSFVMCLNLFSILQMQAQQDEKWINWLHNKQFKEIISQADSLTTSDSTNIQTMRTIGEAYEGFLNYKKAYETYQYCLTLDTTSLDLLTTLGRTALSLGKIPDAEHYFERVLQQDSTHFFARYQLAQLNYQTGNYEKAVIQLETLQKQYPENAMVEYELGNSCLKLQDPISAFFAYSNAFLLNKENPLFASSVINLMLRNGKEQAQEALQICDTSLYYNPNNRTLLQYKGMGHYIAEDYLKADSVYTQLLAAGDSSYMTLKYGGASRYYAGLFFSSIDPLEKAFKEDTTSAEVCMLLGSALGKTYDRKRAYALFKQAEINLLPPKNMVRRLARFRAETMEKDGKREQAAVIYYQLWKEDPDISFSLLERIAWFYTQPAIYFYTDEKQMQRGLFIHSLLATEWLRIKKDSTVNQLNRKLLESFHDYMDKRSLTEMTALAPDSTQKTLTADSLKTILNRLPIVVEKRQEHGWNAESYALEMYQQWQKNPKELMPLRYLVANAYRATNQSYITREEDRGLILSLNYLYATEWLKSQGKTGKPEELPPTVKSLLQSFYEYMETKQLDKLTIYTLDKKKSAVSITELKSVIDQLPNPSQETKRE